MNPVLIVVIPLGLIIVGMILNSFDLGFDQPASSGEQDPTKRLAVERESYRKFFERQRNRAVKRQKTGRPVCLVAHRRVHLGPSSGCTWIR